MAPAQVANEVGDHVLIEGVDAHTTCLHPIGEMADNPYLISGPRLSSA